MDYLVLDIFDRGRELLGLYGLQGDRGVGRG